MEVPKPETVKVNSWKGVLLGLGLAIISSLTTWFINEQSNRAEERRLQVEEQLKLDKRELEVRALEAEKRATDLEIANKIKQRSEDSFDKGISIYREMYKLLEETQADRALVIVAHDGGGEMRPGSEKKFDILYEAHIGKIARNIKGKYQDYPFDEGNFRLAADAINHTNQAIYIPDVTIEPLLANDLTQEVLRFEGIKALAIKYIGIDEVDKKNMYFIYLNFFEANPHKKVDFIFKI